MNKPRKQIRSKPRLTVYVTRPVADCLALACKRPGASASNIVDAALDRFLSPLRDASSDAAQLRRLDQLNRQLAELARNQDILLESLALFIRYYLTITVALPKSDQEPAKLIGNQRFEMFLAQLGKRMVSGARLSQDLMERVLAPQQKQDSKQDINAVTESPDSDGPMPSSGTERGQAPASSSRQPASTLHREGREAMPAQPVKKNGVQP
jgi:hypothetical protein